MEILSRTTESVKIVETRVQKEDEVYFVKDYYNESDKIIDTVVTTKGGYIVDDPAEYQEILDFIDSIEE